MSNSNILKIGSLLNKFPNNGSKIELSKELKDALVGVWLAYGKSNDSTDRNIIKNKIKNRGGDFVISNAAFKLNSGFGKYEVDFTSWNLSSYVSNIRHDSFDVNKDGTSVFVLYKNIDSSSSDTPSFKIKVSNLINSIIYAYINDNGVRSFFNIKENGEYILPKSYNSLTPTTTWIGFKQEPDVNCECTITQIPSYQGAFVTDGVNDLITSAKTVQEMGITDEVTVVSMIHQIDKPSNFITTNNIRTSGSVVGRNAISLTDKTGIYGWYKDNIQGSTINVINNILGDKADYTASASSNTNLSSKFSVVGYISNDSIIETSQVAWYWTIIANKVLTTDQINQVIAYFNLDRTLKPDILCNTIKQGITNENHAEFGDRLIDFSGNGRDIQLNNIAWKGDSGIGKYEVDFLDSSIWNSSNSTITSSKIDCKNAISHIMLLYYSVGSKEYPDIPSFKVIKTGADIDYSYIDETGSPKSVKIVDGVNILPASHNTLYSGSGRFCGFGNPGMGNSVTITQIPSHAGGLCLDGINDFGKVTGMPVYKDYTIIADYERFYLEPITGGRASILSKSSKVGDGSFIFNLEDQNGGKACYTFGEANDNISDDITRIIRYQSKYYNTKTLSIGTAEDNDFMVLGKVREADSRYFYGAIYSLMSFPYSMSEFLIERQLKKHKLGTLYPDMVEFRPVIKSNVLLDAKPTFVIRGTSTYLNAGDYVPENSQIWVSIKMNNIADRITKFTVNGKTIDIPENAYSEVTLQYGFPFVIDKSPQKITMTIEQDENYVLFNPVINSNYDNYKLTFHLREYEKLINIGDYIPKGTYIRANLYLKNDIDELVTFTFNGVNIDYAKSPVLDTAYNIRQIYNYDSPQEVNITIDEYIRYEDIVQPYPVKFRFTDVDSGQVYDWGSKIKVGSTIKILSNVDIGNYLSDIYTITGYKYNGKIYFYNELKELTFLITNQPLEFASRKTYKLGGSEPKVILYPERLKLSNDTYKRLGYIPDLTGNGNHGVIHNSAYAEMSGANGYPYDYRNSSFWCDSVLAKVVSGELIEYFAVKNSTGFSNITSGVYKGEIKVTGVTKAISENKISRLRIYTNSTTDNELIDITQDGNYNIDMKGVGDANRVFFYAIPNNPNESIVVRLTEPIYIEQVGEYEGAYCLDGVDDFVTIPTIVGGKQVLMKVNWDKTIADAILYDQRGYPNEFAIYNADVDNNNPVFAYQARNNGQTYIDGILNKNIKASELRAITHNITITNELSTGTNTSSPVIGSNRVHDAYFTNMALYDFMLFDEISTDDKIKELNEYVGIEGNFVEWNPTITTNISSTYTISPNIRKSDGITVKLVKGNIYSTSITGNLVLDIVPPNKDLDEVTNVIIDGKSYTPIKYQYADYYRVEIPLVFPQEINITIDEYIRYESIEQPYPIFLNYIDKETNKTYTWGDKVKVDSILKISGYKNLFENGDTSLGGSNGYSVNGSSELIALGTLLTSEILVNKINTGVRSSVIWNLNTPKPLFAYDPSIINNVGLKNLGYLPDITGQGRHLLLNEFAYEGMSGINGYPVVLGVNKTWESLSSVYNYTSDVTSTTIHVTHVEHAGNGLLFSYVKKDGVLTNIKEIPAFRVTIKGLEGNSRVRYYYLATENATSNSILNLKNGINEISKSFIPTDTLLNNSNNVWIGFSISAISDEVNSFDCDITIEILPNYEGALCFDGINDYGTVSNLPSQYIKTLLMKVNWMKDTPMLLYDQRGGSYFGILTTQESDINNTKIAYQARNPNGKTYIDGIENNYIETYTLKDITHNITITNSNVNTIITPVIGSNSGHSANFAKMAMYKVMGLPEIPSDEEIKTLNNWAGIEAKVELPPYYWDAYGKTNLDGDNTTIQQRGVAVGDFDLTNTNFAYDNMSGFGGYTLGKFTNSWSLSNNSNSISIVSRNPYDITLKKLGGNSDWEFNNTELKVISNPVSVKFKSNKNIRVTCDYHYYPVGGNSNAPLEITSKDLIANEDTIITISPISQENIDKYNIDINRGYYLICFQLSPTLEVNEEVTIEMLPLYPNGLVLDGVDDYLINENIPAFTDFTYILKRELLTNTVDTCSVFKGTKYAAGGWAFIADYYNSNGKTTGYSFGNAVLYTTNEKTIYGTKTSVNGNTIVPGPNVDELGITLGKWSSANYKKMVFYKLMLYPKTLTNLEIMFLKNMFERDEIINLNNPIFIQK